MTSVDLLDGWLDLIEAITANPAILVQMRTDDPALADEVSRIIEGLAAEARHHEWRDPDPHVGARPEQLMPGTPGSFSDETDWDVVLVMGGRGSGKSRTGGEDVREMTLEREWRHAPRIALVGQTLDAVRTDMVEETLLEVLPPGSIAKWNRNSVELWVYLPDKHMGRRRRASFRGYSSEAPRKLRGPNFAFAWADEIGTWKDADRSPQAPDTTWSNLANAVRARDDGTWVPRIIATTTPRSRKLIRNPDPTDPLNPGPGLYDDPRTVRVHMSTLDNREHLAPAMLQRVEAYRGTRLWVQEIEGRLLDEDEGAMWSFELVQQMRVPGVYPAHQAGGLVKVVVAVDPSIGAGRGDECGIVVAGLAADGRAYVLEDCSLRAAADEWCQRVREAFQRHRANLVVVETNQGGELVGQTLRRYAPNLPIVDVWAKRGKRLRAEPVHMMSEQDRVRLAGDFDRLEYQMRTWDPEDPKQESPDRLDAFVYAVLHLLPVDDGIGELITSRRFGRRA